MYFPYLRGRQYELLAIRDLLDKGLLSEDIVPLIEPVKLSSTFVNALSSFESKGHKIAIITNPSVGKFDLEYSMDSRLAQQAAELFESSQSLLFAKFISTEARQSFFEDWTQNNIIAICKNQDDFLDYMKQFGNGNDIAYTLIPDSRRIQSRILSNKIKLEDKFQKQLRNQDYLNLEDEFFSDDHIYYKDDGYQGFSDYSIVGDDYSESGFAPYAVAIHIVYFDEDKNMRVRHFVSNSNFDPTNPAGKFSEALGKMIAWLDSVDVFETFAINQFRKFYETETYPGLGVVKKLSIMHHLELISRYFDGEV